MQLSPGLPVMVYGRHFALIFSRTRMKNGVPGVVILDRKVRGYWSHAVEDVKPIGQSAGAKLGSRAGGLPKAEA